MQRIESETELLELLKADITGTPLPVVTIFAGHFPLVYGLDTLREDFARWGDFSLYTLELGCQIAETTRDLGKKVRFALFADDRTYTRQVPSSQIKTRRNAFYKMRSGLDASLPAQCQKILARFGFDEHDVIRHEHGKLGREDCLYFSEQVLIRDGDPNIGNSCAREYVSFLRDPRYFDVEKSYYIAFIPNRCRANICDVALDLEMGFLHASHVFLPTASITSRRTMYEQGPVWYRKEK